MRRHYAYRIFFSLRIGLRSVVMLSHMLSRRFPSLGCRLLREIVDQILENVYQMNTIRY